MEGLFGNMKGEGRERNRVICLEGLLIVDNLSRADRQAKNRTLELSDTEQHCCGRHK
jgi:hypothetical protein